jgi:hypothetical protein
MSDPTPQTTPINNLPMLQVSYQPSQFPPNAQLGQFGLFEDQSWAEGKGMVFSVSDYVAAQRQMINGTPIQDRAQFAWFYLPVGTVVTLMDNAIPTPSGKPCFDIANCGRCVDLIGTGSLVVIRLSDANMQNCVSAFYWRDVNLNMGTFVLYENAWFQANRTVLFLQDWPDGQVCPITDWYLEDKVSSVDWTSLDDCQLASLFQNADGSGKAYANIHGWGTTKRIPDLNAVGFNDCMSSFQWTSLVPMKEVIPPYTISLNAVDFNTNVTNLQASTVHKNNTGVAQTFSATLKDTNTCSVTVQVTSTIVTSVTTTFTQSFKYQGLGAEATSTLSISLQFQYTNSHSTTTSVTNALEIDITENTTAQPQGTTTAVLSVQVAQLNAMPCSVNATRWYNQPVTGAVQDPTNNNWWMRTETVNFTVSGGLASNASISTSFTAN